MKEREKEHDTTVYIPTTSELVGRWGRRWHDAFVAGKQHIFVLPGKSGEREPECHTDAVAVLRHGGARQVFDPVGRPRVHQEVEGVHPLGPGFGGCAVEHVDARRGSRRRRAPRRAG
jgi:hypothetical protein